MDTTIINISISKKLLKEADVIAKKESRNRSELFREALRGYLIKQKELSEMFDYGKSQAKKLGIKKADINRLIMETRDEVKNSA
ncbi:MAG: ribbon-helix-helix protein, CopG family [Candidatus Berkelbacteria bacterium]|nr:ribbon-helix-helix protein, CopG family [Candidatus Berkelbacteria bacterium]